jgi:hypothetical protein
MNLTKPISAMCLAIFLVSCAPINADFVCNKTATDKCLDIAEVNALTEGDSDV